MIFLVPVLPALSVLLEAALLGAATTVGARLASDAYDALTSPNSASGGGSPDSQQA